MTTEEGSVITLVFSALRGQERLSTAVGIAGHLESTDGRYRDGDSDRGVE
jgi:hypothetical protein